MDLLMIIACVFMAGMVSGLIVSLKLRDLQEAREKNSIRAKRLVFQPMEIYDLKPDEWKEVG
ncbi:Uncharacterised protein [uncultured Clostridium sp.]|uniref:Uncharacterized protein n=1 Tax=Muricoprocola aceti TaxID=2981772 RepID=A0ABT2SNB0_9FIRM|nr:hypothetical protein [Muricoprocola aceti]MCU6725745.1 hypothetical protein [Muricoprocola aceti]SCH63288.1 Uncharacterised protein [uncultured Clostridium sp.]